MITNSIGVKTSLPNFLIVGAAKSGTTSLYYYLNQHPEVYMSPVKEPKFMIAQYIKHPIAKIVNSFDEYTKLFNSVKTEKAIGEASANYLYCYKHAINNIKKYLGDVKIVIILRSPIERAFSSYQMAVRLQREYLSFEEALKYEDERRNLDTDDCSGWFYKNPGFYYPQVKAYTENFRQVKIYLYDDLKINALSLVKDLYEFLEVNSSFTPDINSEYNVGGIPKNNFIYNLLFNRYYFKNIMPKTFSYLLGEEKIADLKERLRALILKKERMKLETREFLKNLYREDIQKLGDLIHRDLSHWLK